jgi:hypothetical protein
VKQAKLKSKGAQERSLTKVTAGGSPEDKNIGEPYSPSQAVEPMDWGQNLDGVKRIMQELPPSTHGEEGVPATAPPATNPPGVVGRTSASSSAADTIGGDNGLDSNIASRCMAFLQKAKDDAIIKIKDQIGRDFMLYETIRAHKRRNLTAITFVQQEENPPAGLDGMVKMGELRLLSGGLKYDMKTKRIITTSYKPDWSCLACGPHGSRPAFNFRGAAGGTGPPQAVLLTDQCFPPILPAAGAEKCLIILRIENGSVPDLVDEFLTEFGNRLFPAGGHGGDSGGEHSGGQRGGWRGETRGSLTYRGARDSGRGGGERGHGNARGRGGQPYYGQRPGGGRYMGRRALGSRHSGYH